ADPERRLMRARSHCRVAAAATRKRPRRSGALRTAQDGSAAVAVEVARHGAFDVVPALADRAFGVVPGHGRLPARAVPLALELRLHVLEALAAVLRVGVVAVLVRRLVVVPGV